MRKMREWNEAVITRARQGKSAGSGPTKAVLNTFRELGWKMERPFEMEDDEGIVHISTLAISAYMRRELNRSMDRKQLKDIQQKLREQGFENAGNASLEVARQLMNSETVSELAKLRFAQAISGQLA